MEGRFSFQSPPHVNLSIKEKHKSSDALVISHRGLHGSFWILKNNTRRKLSRGCNDFTASAEVTSNASRRIYKEIITASLCELTNFHTLLLLLGKNMKNSTSYFSRFVITAHLKIL